jgi:hypothetical protein
VSNLTQPNAAGSLEFPYEPAPISDDNWQASQFHTGTEGLTFTLTNVVLSMENATGAADGFFLSIYNDPLGVPGSIVGTFDLSASDDPATAGDNVFIPNGTITLNGGTDYWLVAGATSLTADNSYSWNYPEVDTSFDADPEFSGWAINSHDYAYKQNDVDGWVVVDGGGGFKFSVTAEVETVPEPSTYALFLLGAAVIFWQVRRKQAIAVR